MIREVRGLIIGIGLMSVPLAYKADAPGGIDWSAVAAIGAVLAVFVAALIAVYQRYADQADKLRARKLKSRALSHQIYPALLELRVHVRRVIGRWKEYSPEKMPNGVAFLKAVDLPALPEFKAVTDNIEVFDQGLAASMMQMLALVAQYNRMLNVVAADGAAEILPKLFAPIPVAVERLLEEIMPDVQSIHDTKLPD